MPKVQDAQVKGKQVLVRLDLDVPLRITNHESQITDDTRLEDGLETVKYLLNHGATVIVIGHLGRPPRQFSVTSSQLPVDEKDKAFSLKPVAKWFMKLKIKSGKFKVEKTKFGEFAGWKLAGNFFILENIRFYKGEEDNDPKFTKKLASLGDMYVNDAFAVNHRSHASIVGLPKLLPHFAGFHLQKEVEVLSKVLQNPKRPLVVIIGGAKIETKLPLVEKMHQLADYVLVGGKIAEETWVLLKVQHEKVKNRISVLLVGQLNQQETDMTTESVENFLQIVQLAKTIVWSGPIGKTEEKKFAMGSRKLAEGIIKSKAYSIIGGGDTLGFLKEIGILNKFSFVSSGGGAMLQFLSGEKVPGIEVLEKS